jgi:ribose transport system substrate-binding protein
MDGSMKRTISKKAVLLGFCMMLATGTIFAAGRGGTQGETYIPLVSKGFQHQFWQAVRQGAEQAAAEFGVRINFVGPETEAMVDRQIDMLSTELARNPAALGFAALDSRAATPLLQQAQRSNIPVIAFDSGVESDIPLTTVSTDNRAAAAMAADRMAQALGGTGRVAIIAHDQTSRTGIERRDGFVERIAAAHPGIQIVDVQYGGGDHLRSADIVKAVINGNPDLRGYYGTNEGSAIGIVNAVTELNLPAGQLTVIGFDSGRLQLDAIRSGLMHGAVQQNPVGMGYETVRAAVRALRGETLPNHIDSGFVWADRSNIDSAEVRAVVYE